MARADVPVNRAVPDQTEFWRARLDGVPPLELPADRPRPVIRSTATALHTRELPAPAARALTDLAERHATGRTAVLAAAVTALLTRYSGQEDIALGAVSPRTGHMLVLRTGADASAPFAVLLRDTARALEDALAHDGVPFAALVEALAPARDTSITPYVQAVVADLDELPLEQRGFDPLDLSFEVSDGGRCLRVRYSTALFDESTAAGLAGRLAVLLAAPRRAPACPSPPCPCSRTASSSRSSTPGTTPRAKCPPAPSPSCTPPRPPPGPTRRRRHRRPGPRHLPGTGRAGQPDRPPPRRARRRARPAGRSVRRAERRHGRRPARHHEGRRGLPAARPVLSRRPARLHAPGLRRPPRRHPARAARPAAGHGRRPRRPHRRPGRPRRPPRHRPRRGARARRPGVRHLHLRLHRPPQGASSSPTAASATWPPCRPRRSA